MASPSLLMNHAKTGLDIVNTAFAIKDRFKSKKLAKEQLLAPQKKHQDQQPCPNLQQMQHQYTPLRPHQEQQSSKPRFSGSQQPSFLAQRQAPAAGYGPASSLSPPEARQKVDMDGAKTGRESSATQLHVTNVINNFFVVGGAVTGPNFPALGIKGAGAGAGPKAPASGIEETGARAGLKFPPRGNKGTRVGAPRNLQSAAPGVIKR